MPNYNKAIVVGHLTRDIDIRQTAGGASVGDTAIAVTRKYKAGNEQREETMFLDCTLWGKTAEICAEYAGKGSAILFEGYLKQETWEDKDTGKNRSKIKLVVESMQFLKNKGGGESPQRQESSNSSADGQFDDYGAGDEVPF